MTIGLYINNISKIIYQKNNLMILIILYNHRIFQ